MPDQLRTIANRSGRPSLRAVALIALALLLLLAGCVTEASAPTTLPAPTLAVAEEPEPIGLAEQPSEEGQTRTVTLALAGVSGMIPWAERALGEINAALEEEGTALRLDIRIMDYYSGAIWPEPTSVGMISALETGAGDPFDLVLLQTDPLYGLNFRDLVKKEAFCDITEAVREFPNLYALTPERAWRETAIDGRLYCFPLVQDFEGRSSLSSTVGVRKSTLTALGAACPTDPDEFLGLALRAKSFDAALPNKLYVAHSTPLAAFHRAYEQWPFLVDDQSRFVFHADGSVEPYLGSDVMAQDRHLLAQWAANDLLMVEDLHAWGEDEYRKQALVALIPKYVYIEMEMVDGFFTSVGDGGAEHAVVAPDSVNIRTGPCANSAIAVSSRASSVEDALRMVQFLYTNRQMSDALIYGEKDKDWVLHEDGSAEIFMSYSHNIDFLHDAVMRPYHGEQDVTLIPAVEFPASGFTFVEPEDAPWGIDFTPVYELRNGVRPPEDEEEVLGLLNAQGFEQMMQECRRQYAAFLEAIEFSAP